MCECPVECLCNRQCGPDRGKTNRGTRDREHYRTWQSKQEAEKGSKDNGDRLVDLMANHMCDLVEKEVRSALRMLYGGDQSVTLYYVCLGSRSGVSYGDS